MSEHIDRLIALVDAAIGPLEGTDPPMPTAEEVDGAYLVPESWWDKRPKS